MSPVLGQQSLLPLQKKPSGSQKLAAAPIVDCHVVSSGSIDGGYMDITMPLVAAWPLVAARPPGINMISYGSPDHGHQHGLQQPQHRQWKSTWPPEVPRTYRGLLSRLNAESERFILDILLLLRARVIV